MGRSQLCCRCLIPLESFAGNPPPLQTKTACCAKSICYTCLDACDVCPVCRSHSVKNDEAQVPSYPSTQASFSSAQQSEEPPSYNEVSELSNASATYEANFNSAAANLDGRNTTSNSSYITEVDTAEVVENGDSINVIHYISNRDTLVGLSLKYNVSVDEIKRANKMFSNNIHEHEKLIIPGVKHLPKSMSDMSDEMKQERYRQRVTKRFQLVTKCVDPAEAQFYMEDNDYSLDTAVQKYLDDLKWEKEHPSPNSKIYKRKQNSVPSIPPSLRTKPLQPFSFPEKVSFGNSVEMTLLGKSAKNLQLY